MELLQELLTTTFLAVVFSFLVAKLVSIAIAGDIASDSNENVDFETVVEEVKFGRGFIVQRTETERRLQFVEQVTEIVDEFQAQRPLHADRIEVGESAGEVSDVVVGVPENSSELVGGFEFEGVEEGTALTGLEGLIVEGRSESRKADQFDGDREEENIETTGLDCTIDEEKIIENTKADDEIDVELGKNDVVVDKSECGENQGSLIEGKLSGRDGEKGCLVSHEEKIVENAKADDEIDVELGNNDEVVLDKSEFGENQGSGIEGKLSGRDEEKDGLVSDEEDDWEGIERSELEKVFAMAARYVGYGGERDGLANDGSDVQMQLYGLHKVAMEGACHETQPMVLKIAARAKWNAWKRLGNMSPEVAMEQYITILSDKVPGWMEPDSAADGKGDSGSGLPYVNKV